MEALTISAKSVDRYIYDENTIIADIRDANDFKAYHIKNSVNFPDETIFDRLYVLDKYKLVILCCDRGVNSLITAKKLYNMKYNVKSIVGGIAFYRQSHKS